MTSDGMTDEVKAYVIKSVDSFENKMLFQY